MFKVDYVSVFIKWPNNSQYYMLILSNQIITVLHNIMGSIGKNVTHKAEEKINT